MKLCKFSGFPVNNFVLFQSYFNFLSSYFSRLNNQRGVYELPYLCSKVYEAIFAHQKRYSLFKNILIGRIECFVLVSPEKKINLNNPAYG